MRRATISRITWYPSLEFWKCGLAIPPADRLYSVQSVALGGNVRVGLEGSLWIGPGPLAESNAQQVRAARQGIEGLGLEVARPDDARELLQLKGGSNVNF